MPKALSLAVELFLFFFSSPNLGSFGRGTASHQTYARGSAVAEHGVLLRNLAHLSPNFMGAFIFDHTRLWGAIVSKWSEISDIQNKFDERRWLRCVL